MRHNYLKTAGIVSLLIASGCLSSCIDDNYDLSDIDTTTQLTVKDLTVPVNLKDILLDKIIDTDDSDPNAVIRVREINGKKVYFFSKEGDFHAEPTHVDKVYAPKPDFSETSTSQIDLQTQLSAPRKAAGMPDYLDFAIKHDETEFEYRVGRDGNPKVDSSILSIVGIALDADGLLTISMEFSSQAAEAVASKVEIRNLDLICPEVLKAEYNGIHSANGHLLIPLVESTNGKIRVDIKVTNMDFVTSANPNGIKVDDGCFDFKETIGCYGGTLRVYPKANLQMSQIPANVDFNTRYGLTAFTVSAVSGEFRIDANFDELQSLYLDDIPEFLAGQNTSVAFANPALTLQVNNPVARYGLQCQTGLTLHAERNNGGAGRTETLNLFTVPSTSTDQFHVVAPESTAIDYVTNTTGLSPIFTSFPGLGDILAGEGIPSRIDIDFKSATQPTPVVSGKAVNFPLGVDLPRIEGKYRFETPLALASGSQIVYTKTIDGWNDEDVDAIAISEVKVNAKISTDIPAGVKVHVYPVGIDEQGNTYRIPLTNPDEAIATLPANATDNPVTISLKGDIRHLDGIYIEAIADDFDGAALSPQQNIRVADLKATVSGTYTKKL